MNEWVGIVTAAVLFVLFWALIISILAMVAHQ